jgi:hypothetical protein
VPKAGGAAYQRIEIDGKVPFSLFAEYPFLSVNPLSCSRLEDEQGNPLKIYLTKGPHEISLEAKVGPARQAVKAVEAATARMDALYRSISLITASIRDQNGRVISDPNRDYNLDKKIPGLSRGPAGGGCRQPACDQPEREAAGIFRARTRREDAAENERGP